MRVIGHWLSPDYMIPAAKAYHRDPVLGAPSAYREVRDLVRQYIRFCRWRDGEREFSLTLAQAFRALGWVGVPQRVERASRPEDATTEWRETALVIWDGSRGVIPGHTAPIPIHGKRQGFVNRAVLRALGKFFEHHDQFNVSVLRDRIYHRLQPGLLTNVEPKSGGVASYLLRPEDSDAAVHAQMRRATARLAEISDHPLRKLGFLLLRGWAKHGLIYSPGSAMVSLAGIRGWAALSPFNGIPLAIQVGPVEEDTVTIFATIDHRAYDGSFARILYGYLEHEVACLCA